MPWGLVEHVRRRIRCTGVHWGYETIGVQNLGEGSAGSLSSYSFPFLLFKAVACFLSQCVELSQRK
jgi:hypothetical protein